MLYVNQNDEKFEIKEEELETKPFCECRDSYGQILGCYDAGCYSLNNCTIAKEVAIEIAERLGLNYDFENFDVSEFVISFEETEGFEETREEIEMHYEVTVYEEFVSGNWKSYVVKSELDLPADLQKID